MSRPEPTADTIVGYPPTTGEVTIYAVGDIHGRLDLLEEVHRQIDRDKEVAQPQQAVEIYLGDYIDRGPESAGVVSKLIARAHEQSAVFLRGNHEQLLLDFLAGGDCLREWRSVGAVSTLQSYGLAPDLLLRDVPQEAVRRALAERLPPEHAAFYADTGAYLEAGPYLFVHAGIRPGIALEQQEPGEMLTIRAEFLDCEHSFTHIVVHGHSPVMSPDFRPNRINIDTGAFATNRLTCLKIDGAGVRVLSSG